MKNTVGALKSLSDTDYLNSPEFNKVILLKFPNSLLLEYKGYTAVEGKGKSKLERIADFMIREAKQAEETGIITLHNESTIDKSKGSRSSKPKLTLLTNAVTSNDSEIENCIYCQQ